MINPKTYAVKPDADYTVKLVVGYRKRKLPKLRPVWLANLNCSVITDGCAYSGETVFNIVKDHEGLTRTAQWLVADRGHIATIRLEINIPGDNWYVLCAWNAYDGWYTSTTTMTLTLGEAAS